MDDEAPTQDAMNKTNILGVYGEARTRPQGDSELARRLRNQATMIGAVAHEIRSPLFRLAIAVELAKATHDDRVALARSHEAIIDALSSITRMVDDLDDYGSLQAGRLRLICRPISPVKIVRSALATFAPVAGPRQIVLSERIADALPDILGDHDRLQHVVSTLLTNAMCLTPPGGRIIVAVDEDGDHVRFAISDSGPGIGLAELPNVFDRRWRGTRGRFVGRGLGLVIARELVKGHGGKMWADNEPGLGARFSFTVPVAGGRPRT